MAAAAVNAVYYPSWHLYQGRTPAQIPVAAAGITHVYYAFLRLTAEGAIQLLDRKADVDAAVDGERGCLGALAALRRATGVRTLVSVGGGGTAPVFAQMARSAGARARFAREVRAFVDEHGLDGVDIDWEHPTTRADGHAYILLLETLRAALPAPEYLLTSALPVGRYCLAHIDLAAAGRALDMVNLMCYDFHGPWSAAAGHQSQLFATAHNPLVSGEGGEDGEHSHSPSHGHRPPPPPPPPPPPSSQKTCVTGTAYLLSQSVPAAKVILGIPTYAYVFAGARMPGDAFRHAESVENGHFAEAAWGRVCVDEDTGAAWVPWRAWGGNDDGAGDDDDDDGGGGFATLDVPATVRAKARFVRRHGLGGLFYWHVFGDCGGEERSLIRAGRDALAAGGEVSVADFCV